MSKEYIQKIDFFRAISILLVVLFHLDVTIFQGGFIGVDIFFVISGFLITKIIKAELDETGQFNFGKFYLKRARRLLPSLFLLLSLVYIFSYAIFSPGDFIKSTQSIFMAAVIVSNFFFYKESGYFDQSSELEPLLHTWSLGIEEQFYLIWPLTLYLMFRFFSKRFLFITATILFISLFITYTLNHFDGGFSLSFLKNFDNIQLKSAIFYLLPFRIFEFLVGAICLFYLDKKEKIKTYSLLINLIGLTIIILSAIFFNKQLNFLGVLNIIPCIGIAILIITEVPSKLQPIYYNKHIGLIGKASYTWYLFHWPMIAFMKYFYERSLTITESILIFFSSLVVSILIYKYFENPIRYYKKEYSFNQNKLFVFSIVTFIFATGILTYSVSTNKGFLSRLDSTQNVLAGKFKNVEDFHKNYWGGADYKPGIIGNIEGSNKRIDLVLLGESHCGHFMYGIDSIFVKKYRKNVYIPNLMNPSAIFLPDVIPTHLKEIKVKQILNKTIKVLKENPDATLLISHYWAVQLNRSKAKLADGRIVQLGNNEQSFNLLMNKIKKLLDLAGERKVIIFGSGPIMPYSNKLNHIERMLKPNYQGNTKDLTTTFVPDKNYYLINQFFEQFAAGVPNLFYFDPRAPFCNEKSCLVQKENQIFLSDWDHLSKDGSLTLIEYFEKRMLRIIN